MVDLNDLYYFVQVVAHGGFAPAARALGVPKSKLSRRVASLEQTLGVRLIQRSTRRFLVTELGQTYLGHCKAMVVEAEAAQELIERTHTEPCGTVRLTCPIALLDTEVGPMLAAFLALHPRVLLHVEASNRRVDLGAEAVDVALRVRPPPLADSDVVMRTLAERGQCLVASPGLVERLGAPQIPGDLSRLPSLAFGSPQAEHHWQLFGPEGQEATVIHQPRLVCSGMIALRDAAVAGVGAAQLPTTMVQEALAAGALLRLLPGWAPKREIVHAVFASRRGLLPSVRALIDFLVARFRGLEEEGG